MGYYNLIDSDSKSVNDFASRIGKIITLFNYLEYQIEIFIEAILDLGGNKSSTSAIVITIRNFEFNRRIKFLKLLIKKNHLDEFENYSKLHGEIILASEVRNSIAHAQIYFWDDPKGTHMMISNMKKSELPPEKAYEEMTLKELDKYIYNLQKLKNKFDSFTYKLGYFQAHRVP